MHKLTIIDVLKKSVHFKILLAMIILYFAFFFILKEADTSKTLFYIVSFCYSVGVIHPIFILFKQVKFRNY